MAKQKFCPQGHDTEVTGRTRSFACKECLKTANAKWRAEHRSQHEDYQQMYKAEKYARRMEEAIRNNGGSTACAICRREQGRMVIDHSHKTGKVRGLLCNSCNVALGLLQEDEELFVRALSYLKEYDHARQ